MNLSFKKYGPILLIAFSLICFGGAYFLNQEKVVSFSPITFSYTTQNYFGPIHVTQKNSTYKVVVKQSQTIQKSYVTIEAELLDETRKPFFGFSGELFYEQGIDRNGPWAESNDEVASRVNIENPGKYLLLLKAKSSFKSPETKLTVIIYKVRGSFIPVLLLGVILLIVGLISNKLLNPRGTE